MKARTTGCLMAPFYLLVAMAAAGQVLGPKCKKIKDGIYVYTDKLNDSMHKSGKSLDQIKQELKVAGTEDWEGQDRFPTDIEAAYRAVAAK